MRKIKQIISDSNLIMEEDSDMRKLSTLARSGLFDPKKLPLLKRAMEKDASKMTPADKKILLELLDSLMAEVLHSSSVYMKVKQNVMSDKDLHEAKIKSDHLSKFDPRFDMNYPSDSDLPQIIILKRKAIRVYPDSQKVGLYYSQALDRYISIPFGSGIPVMNEETELNEVSKQKATATYLARTKKDDEEDDPVSRMKAARTLQYIGKKYGKAVKTQAQSTSKIISQKSSAEKEALRQIKSLEVNPIVGASALAGVGINKAARLLGRGIKTALFHPTVGLIGQPMPSKTKIIKRKVVPPTSTPEPESTPTPPTNVMSTSGITSAKLASQPSFKLEPKTKTISEPAKVSISDQPSDAGLAAASKLEPKTKTISYQSNAAEKIPNIKHGAPRKAGGVFLIPSHPSMKTSAQPKVSFMNKLNEKRIICEFQDTIKDTITKDLFQDFLDKRKETSTKVPSLGSKLINVAKIAAKGAGGLGLALGAYNAYKKGPISPEERAEQSKVATDVASKFARRNKPKKKSDEPQTSPSVEVPSVPKVEPPTVPKVEPPTVPKVEPKTVPPVEVPSVPKVEPPTVPKVEPKPTTDVDVSTKIATGAATATAAATATNSYLRTKANRAKNRPPERPRPRIPFPSLDTPSGEQQQHLLSPKGFGMQIKVNEPKSSVRTALDQRDVNWQRKMMQSSINEMRKINTEKNINIGGNSITINKNIAEKVVSLYDSLNENNKKNMEKMLFESMESFKKVINFAIGQ